MSKPVGLASYDPAWAVVYAKEEARLRPAVGSHVLGLEHIGSTAVPLLLARPSIDILLGTMSPPSETGLDGSLATLGYYYLGWSGSGFGRYWRGVESSSLEFELHVVKYGGLEWRRYLACRDHLRACPREVALFRDLKLATAQWGEVIYEGAKVTFFASIRAD